MDELLNAYSEERLQDSALPPRKKFKIDATPDVPDVLIKTDIYIPDGKEIQYNVTADLLYNKPRQGPTFPHMPNSLASEKNTWNGTLHADFQSGHTFDQQYNTFQRFGYANNPSGPLYNPDGSQNFVGDEEKLKQNQGKTILDVQSQKKKRVGSKDPKDSNFMGPWAPYEDDIMLSSDDEEVAHTEDVKNDIVDDQATDKNDKPTEDKNKTNVAAKEDEDDESLKEKTQLHKKERYDYLGRTYLSAPSGIKIREHDCFLPKKKIHTWSGHTKGISSIELFPNTGHLLLSADLDHKIKIWDVYNNRRVLRTFIGHSKGVKDICFSPDGHHFLSASLDRMIKLWDTESGQVISRFKQDSTPLCVKFYPDDPNLFVAGCYDNSIVQWDCRENSVVLRYERHLGPVNTVTFIDDNRRFVSTSDDKSIRVWDWNIPVDIKYISEPHMHSMPSVSISSSKKWLAFQSLDNQILIYGGNERFKMNRKKQFKGHIVAGYACKPTFSTDGKYIASGDSSGNLFIWDWKSQKIFKKIKAHEGVCISTLWHPVEASKLITAGWDGRIHLWD